MSENLPANERVPESTDASTPRMSGPAWGGLVLVGVGIVLLLRQTGFISLEFNNWWALFILIPAFAIYYQAWNLYRTTEQFNRRVRSMLVGATLMAAVAVIFLFGLSWGTFWPIFLIGGGLMALANSGK